MKEVTLIELSAALPIGKDENGVDWQVPVLVSWTDLDRGWCTIRGKGFGEWRGVQARAKRPDWFELELARAREKFAERAREDARKAGRS